MTTTTLSAAIERAIEDSVRMLVRHGATDQEVAEHIASERKRFAAWATDVLGEIEQRLSRANGTAGGFSDRPRSLTGPAA